MNETRQLSRNVPKKWARRLVIIAIALFAGSLAFYYLPPVFHRWRVQSIVNRFRQAPDQQTAEEIVRLLEDRELSSEEGSEMLAIMTRPKIIIRSSYCVGKTVAISYSYQYDLKFEGKLSNSIFCHIIAGQEELGGGGSSGNCGYQSFPHYCYIDRVFQEGKGVHRIKEPGKYSITLRFRHELVPNQYTEENYGSSFPFNIITRSGGKAVTIKHDENAKPVYSCEYDIPVEFVVLPPEQAEKITLLSSPELDSAVKISVSSKPLACDTSSDERHVIGGLQLTFNSPPCDLFLRVTYRDSAGTIVPDDWGPTRIFAGAGKRTDAILDVRCFIKQKFGKHTGTVELIADEENAYKMPSIKKMWNGKLQFPISFTVKAAGRASQPTNDTNVSDEKTP